MVDYNIDVKIQPNSADIAKVRKDLQSLDQPASSPGRALADGFRKAGSDFSNTNRRMQSGLAGVRKEVSGINGLISKINPLLRQAFAFAGIGLGIRGFVQLADAGARLTNQLRQVTRSTEELTAVQRRLFDIAMASGRPIEQVADLYTQGAFAADALGASQSELFTFIESVGFALQSAGTSAGDMNMQITQLARSFSAGEVSGRAFTQLLSAAPSLAQAMANGLEQTGGSVSRLRQLIESGAISGKQAFDVIVGAVDDLRDQAGKTVPVISDSIENLRSGFVRFIQDSGPASGIASGFAQALDFVAKNLNIVLPILGLFAVALGVNGLIAIATSAATTIIGLGRAIVAMSVALARSPVTLLAVVAAMGAMVAFKDQIGSFFDTVMGGLFGTDEATGALNESLAGLGDTGGGVFRGLGTGAQGLESDIGQLSTSAQDYLTRLGATGTQAGADVANGGRAGANGIDGITRSANQATQALNQLRFGLGTLPGATAGARGSAAFEALQPHAGLARGGAARGSTPYLVGERGPEVIFPSYSGYVATASQTAKMISSGVVSPRAAGGFMNADPVPGTVSHGVYAGWYRYDPSNPNLVRQGGPNFATGGYDLRYKEIYLGDAGYIRGERATGGSARSGGDSINFRDILRSAESGSGLIREAQGLGVINKDIADSLRMFVDTVGQTASMVIAGGRLKPGAITDGFTKAAKTLVGGTEGYAEKLIGSQAFAKYIAPHLAASIMGESAFGSVFGSQGGGGFGGYATTASQLYANPNVYAGAFNNGGSFRVPGSGNSDSKMVSMRLTPGERVSVNRREESGTRSMPITINLVVNGVTDADSFRRNDTQLIARLISQIEAVKRDM